MLRPSMRPSREWRFVVRSPSGPQTAGSVGPKSARVGAPQAAARCVTPESLPTYKPAQLRTAPSARSGQPLATTAPGSARNGAALASSAGPSTRSQGCPAAMASTSALKRSTGQFLAALPLPGCTARKRSGSRARSSPAESASSGPALYEGGNSAAERPRDSTGRASHRDACPDPGAGSGSWATTWEMSRRGSRQARGCGYRQGRDRGRARRRPAPATACRLRTRPRPPLDPRG